MIVTRQPWWFGVVRGTLAVAVGVIALVWPELTATTLIVVFASVILLDGLVGIVAGARSGFESRAPAGGLLQALVALGIGAVGILAPGFSLRFFSVLVGLWAVGTGLIGLFVAGTLGQAFPLGPLLGLLGLGSLVLGIIILFSPRAGVVLVATLTGINAIIFGLGRIALGLRKRRVVSQVDTATGGQWAGPAGNLEFRGQSDITDEAEKDETQE